MKNDALSVVPSTGDAETVRALVAEGETSQNLGAGGAQASGGARFTLALAGLLSSNPKKEEPIEDAFGGMVRELTYPAAC
ncbi:hypothetical protein [Streptomyces sp. NBC_01803]|uniref:hypothetical protein n=1 Tax=Streptomyces sp. NBC_01803 TaxID=2975946 RepID=UPI002DDC545F|nr:hypothetical protein [Streptomyces sp. NBC_01803]WSA43586.1 hypothetical protein OIE51_04840 [Streptomyces sp. NBC_01803]